MYQNKIQYLNCLKSGNGIHWAKKFTALEWQGKNLNTSIKILWMGNGSLQKIISAITIPLPGSMKSVLMNLAFWKTYLQYCMEIECGGRRMVRVPRTTAQGGSSIMDNLRRINKAG